MSPQPDGRRWFWPTIIIGSFLLWGSAWLLSTSDFAYLLGPITLGWSLLIAATCAALLIRAGHHPVAALSVALPIAAALVLDGLFAPSGIVGLAVYGLALGFFVAFSASGQVTRWWYRVVLLSRWQPPET